MRHLLITIAIAFSSLLHAEKPNSVLIVGGQFGDEGKGKIVDFLSQDAESIIRAQGGNNAGHTVVIKDKEYKLHLIPSGILQEDTTCYLGGGVVIDPGVLLKEINQLEEQGINLEGRLWISPYAHVIMPYHRLLDGMSEKKLGKSAIGTTKKGIGPCYADKANRRGVTMADFIDSSFDTILENRLAKANATLEGVYDEEPLAFDDIYEEYSEYASLLKCYVKENLEETVHQNILDGKKILFEGAQGTFLDCTFGTVPFVTSSSTTAGGITSGAGIGPNKVGHVLAIVKAYMTRVGNGPMPTEVIDDEQLSAQKSREFGTTTGRMRRMGWYDALLVKKAVALNGVDSIALMKLDVLDDLEEIQICTAYKIDDEVYTSLPASARLLEKAEPIYETVPGWNESTAEITNYDDLPENAKSYIARLEELSGVPISIVSVGPERDQTIVLKDLFESN